MWNASGWAARIVQHEVDHLAGRMYIDGMQTRSFASNEELFKHPPTHLDAVNDGMQTQ